jgi:hypothetical protein
MAKVEDGAFRTCLFALANCGFYYPSSCPCRGRGAQKRTICSAGPWTAAETASNTTTVLASPRHFRPSGLGHQDGCGRRDDTSKLRRLRTAAVHVGGTGWVVSASLGLPSPSLLASRDEMAPWSLVGVSSLCLAGGYVPAPCPTTRQPDYSRTNRFDGTKRPLTEGRHCEVSRRYTKYTRPRRELSQCHHNGHHTHRQGTSGLAVWRVPIPCDFYFQPFVRTASCPSFGPLQISPFPPDMAMLAPIIGAL